MAAGFQTSVNAIIMIRGSSNQLVPNAQALAINVGPIACIGAAGGEAAAVTAALSALQTAIAAACQTPFVNELIAMETGGG